MRIRDVRLIVAAAVLMTTAACERVKDKTPEVGQIPPPVEEPTQPAPQADQDDVVPPAVTPAPVEPVVVQPAEPAVPRAPAAAVNPQLLRERDALIASMNARVFYLFDHHGWEIVILPKKPEVVRASLKEYPWSHLRPTSLKEIRKELNQQIAEAESLIALRAEGVAVSGVPLIETTIEFSKLYLAELTAFEETQKKEEAPVSAHGG